MALRALLRQMAAGALAGGILVGLDALGGLRPRPMDLRALLGAAVLWAQIGAGWGLAQFGALHLTRRWRRRWANGSDSAERDPVGAVLWLGSVLLVAPTMGAMLVVVLRKLGGVHDEALAASMAALALAGGVVALAVVGAVVLPRLRRVLQRRADAGRLRAPGPAVLLGCGALALTAMELGLRVRFKDELSGAESGLLALALVSISMWLGAVGRSRAPRGCAPPGPAAAWLAGLVGLVGWVVVLLPLGVAADPSSNMRIGRRGLAWLRNVTDLDRDGYSSLLGHGDCAPLDGRVFPTAQDVPDNGVDEDCDGRDAAPSVAGGQRILPLYASSVPPVAESGPLNVIWIVVDAMRADSMSVYGYDKPTTPYLKQLAQESLVFTQAWSQASATMLSIPSMLSGRLPGEMTWVRRDDRLSPSDDEVMLAERLADRGYRTGLIVHSYFLRHFKGLFQGYDKVENVWLDGKMKPWFERSSPIATTLAIRFIERELAAAIDGERPFFLTIYYEDPHHTYATHDEAYPNFRGPSKVVKGIPRKHQGAKARYDGEIAFADRHIGFLLEYLRATPELWARTVVIVVADHGEEFGEHGGTKHGRTCYRESTHVPLIVRVPGVAPRVIDAPVALIDVVPTLTQLLGLDPDPKRMSGASLWAALEGGLDGFAQRPVTCTTIGGNPRVPDVAVRSVRQGGHLLVHDYVNDRDELYLTDADPLEKKDVAAQGEHAARVGELRAWLDATLRGNVIRDRLTR